MGRARQAVKPLLGLKGGGREEGECSWSSKSEAEGLVIKDDDSAQGSNDLETMYAMSDESMQDCDLIFRDPAAQHEWERFAVQGVSPNPVGIHPSATMHTKPAALHSSLQAALGAERERDNVDTVERGCSTAVATSRPHDTLPSQPVSNRKSVARATEEQCRGQEVGDARVLTNETNDAAALQEVGRRKRSSHRPPVQLPCKRESRAIDTSIMTENSAIKPPIATASHNATARAKAQKWGSWLSATQNSASTQLPSQQSRANSSRVQLRGNGNVME